MGLHDTSCRWLCLSAVAAIVSMGAASAAVAAGPVREVDAPGILSESGASYVLTRDITAPATAFIIKGDHITLDLNGHTVTYGTEPGDRVSGVFARPRGREEDFTLIPPEGFGGANHFILKNGRLVEGAGSGHYRHAVYMRGGEGLEVFGLESEVHGADSDNINTVYWGSMHIHHNRLVSRVTEVSNRHYPGQDVIVVWGVGGPIEIDHNTIDGGAQWGIRVNDGEGPPHLVHIHHNVIRHRTYATNGYGLGLHARNMYVHANVVRPVAGRGVHLTGFDIDFFNNIVDVREQPNPEYPRTRAHGVKLEGGRSSRVHHNFIRATAEEGFGDADPLDLSVPAGAANRIDKNTVVALRKTEKFWATTINLIGQPDDNGCVVEDNLFRTEQYHVRVDWDGGSGVLFRRNRFEVIGRPADYVFFRCEPSRALDVKNNVFRDNVLVPPAAYAVQYMYNDYRPTRVANRVENTVTVVVTDPAGKPVPDVDVVASAEGDAVASTATDAAGRGELVLPFLRLLPKEEVRCGPYALSLSKPGWESGSVTVQADEPREAPVTLRSRTAKLYLYAGPDQRRLIGDAVTLPAKVVLAERVTGEPEITWRFLEGNKPIAVSDPHALQPTVTLDAWGSFRFQVEAKLGDEVVKDEVSLRANQTLTPTAQASAPQEARVETIVELDGSRSTDPAGFPLSYRWTQTSGPEALMSSLEWPTPIFYALEPGVYAFELAVANPLGKVSEPVRATVHVTK